LDNPPSLCRAKIGEQRVASRRDGFVANDHGGSGGSDGLAAHGGERALGCGKVLVVADLLKGETVDRRGAASALGLRTCSCGAFPVAS
jgi:hypothetical protein